MTNEVVTINGRCITGCGRPATFAINFGSSCNNELQGCCGYCHRNQPLRNRI